MLTLVAVAAGQFLLFAASSIGATLFLIAGMVIVTGLIPVTASRLVQPSEIGAPQRLPLHLLRRAPFAMIGTFLAGLTTGAFWGLAAAFAERLGFAPGRVGVFVACVIAGGVIAQWPLGRLSDRIGRRLVIVGAAGIGAVFALLLATATGGPEWLLFIFGFGFGAMALCLYALSVAKMNDQLEPHEVLSATRGLLLSSGLGSMFGPLIGGVMFDLAGPRGLPWYLAVVLGILALSGILHSRWMPDPTIEEQSEFVSMECTSQVGLEIAEDPRNRETV
jgi:MFS family permease